MSERDLAPVAATADNQQIAEWLGFIREAMHWRQIDLAEVLSQNLGVPFTDSAVAWWESGKRVIPGAAVAALIKVTGAPEPWKSRELWQDWQRYQDWMWVKRQVGKRKHKRAEAS